MKNKKRLRKKISKYQKIVLNKLLIDTNSLIIPILIKDNKKVLEIQEFLLKNNFIVGAIRQPTVKQAIIRFILKLDVTQKNIHKVCEYLSKVI